MSFPHLPIACDSIFRYYIRLAFAKFLLINLNPSALESLSFLGYTRRESEFLYLAALHSGFFLQRQFDTFAHAPKGRTSGAFVHKAIRKQDVESQTFARGTKLYRILSRRIYQAADIPDSRNRLQHSLRNVTTKLLIFDFVLAHLNQTYLHNEPQKIEYFTEVCKIERHVLPLTVFTHSNGKTSSTRHFVDGFPIFFPTAERNPSQATLTFVDDCTGSIQSFRTYLEHYHSFFIALRQFNFFFISNSPAKFESARKEFCKCFGIATENDSNDHRLRYFQARKQWEDVNTRQLLTKEQILFLSACMRTYSDPYYENFYAAWKINQLNNRELAQKPQISSTFTTLLLPNRYDIFGGL